MMITGICFFSLISLNTIYDGGVSIDIESSIQDFRIGAPELCPSRQALKVGSER